MTRSRGWCFTINNYTEDDIAKVQSFDCRYMVFGKEVGKEGTPHLQGYLYMNNDKTLSAMKKKFHPTAHLEPQKGTPEQASAYCKKDGVVFERGDPPKQGCRSDLCGVRDDILSGKKVDDIALEDPEMYHKYGRTLHKIEDLAMRKKFRTEMTEGVWIYGTTGTGKSEMAFEGFTPESHYHYKYDNSDWQDGYTQQPIVIIDEFRGQIPMHALLTMVDKHPNHVMKRRGREPLPFISKKVIVTSSMHPRDVFKNLNENDKLEQLLRRFKIIQLSKK